MRQLLGDRPTTEERQLRRLRDQLDILNRRRPTALTGRHVYISDIMTKAKVLSKDAQPLAKVRARQKVIASNATHWAALSHTQRSQYEQRARALQGQKQEQLREKKAQLQKAWAQQRDQLQTRKAQAADSMVISQCHFTAAELERLEELACSAQFSGTKGEGLHKQSLKCPLPLSQAAFQAHQQQGTLEFEASPPLCALSKQVACFRDNFRDAVFIVAVDTQDERHYRLIFASQQPMALGWLPLESMEVPAVQVGPGHQSLQSRLLQDIQLCWAYQPAIIDWADVLDGVEAIDVAVALTSSFKAPGVLVSWDFLQPLALLMHELLQEEGRQKTPRTSNVGAAGSARAKQTDPDRPTWVALSVARAHAAAQGSAPAEGTFQKADSPTAEEEDPEKATLEEYETVYAEVEEQRQELQHQSRLPHEELFRWAVLGGQWQQQRTGRAVYGVRVGLRPQTPLHAFAVQLNLPRSSSFERNVYGDEGGRMLGETWCLRMLQLYDSWEAAGQPDAWSAEGVESLTLPGNIKDVVAGLDRRGQKRLEKLISLRP